MAVMSDRWIRERALADGMIEPFEDRQRRDGCISYGLSSYGYDARVADEDRVVLAPAAEYFQCALELVPAADQRVELAGASPRSQAGGVRGERIA